MNKSFILVLLVFLTSFSGYPQGKTVIKKLNFLRFEPYLYKQDDTLHIINFWATWCAPCREELPAFQKVYEKYKGQKVKIQMVSLDFPNQLQSRLIPFIKANQIKPEVILLDDPDQNTWIDKVDPKWSGALPFTVIYNAGFRKSFEQQLDFQTLDSIINRNIIMP